MSSNVHANVESGIRQSNMKQSAGFNPSAEHTAAAAAGEATTSSADARHHLTLSKSLPITLNADLENQLRRREESVPARRGKTISEKLSGQDDAHIAHIKHQQSYLLKVCRGLMMYGAPTYRLEEYMRRTAGVLDLHQQSFYLPGCMIISFSDADSIANDVHIVRCTQKLNLAKLYAVHAVYKDVIHDRIATEQAITRLDAISTESDLFPRWVCVIVYGLASMCIGPVSYQARPIDLPLIFLLGCILAVSDLVLANHSELYAHIFEIFTTIIVSFLARALGSIRLPHGRDFCFSALTQASLVMILPGFIITNSALELQSKNIVAGSVRMVYGIIFTLFLAFGTTIGTTLYGALDASAVSSTTCSSPWPFWWQIIFVPAFTLAWVIVNQAPWRKMPAMIVLTLAGWVVNHFASQRFSANTAISQGLGALTIGILANLYSRFGHAFAAALLHPAIFIQVPGSFAANGGLISGIQSANAINNQTSSNDGTSLGTGAQPNFALLNAGYSMIEIGIGITVGLSVSALVVYPIRKKKGNSGLFSF